METQNSSPLSEFVNRDNELRNIEESLYLLTTPGKLLQKQILEFNGVSGIGKTMLLKRLSQECKAITNLRYSFIDFSEFFHNQKIDLNIIIIRIVRQIDIRNQLFNQITGNDGDTDNIWDLTPELIEYLKSILETSQEKEPLALIFDSVDEVGWDVKDWLISIVDRTINAGKILFAIASKISLDFTNKPNLKRKTYSIRLTELDKEYTLRQIQSFSHFNTTEPLVDWTQAVFQITCGHPLANKVVVSEAQKKNYLPQQVNDEQYEFARLIDQEIIEKSVLRRYDIEGASRFRKMLTPLAIPRMFNLVSMGELIKRFAPEYKLESSWHYSNHIRKLQGESFFVRYSREKSAYIVDPVLRNVFSLMLKHEKPESFKEISEFLVIMYSEWIIEAKGTDKTKFFLEKMYHQISLAKPAEFLLSQFKDFAQTISHNIDQEKRLDAKQQFIEEFSLDQDLKEFFDESAQKAVLQMFNDI